MENNKVISLHEAVRRDDADKLRALLKSGVDVNYVDKNRKNTSLHIAAIYKRTDMVTLLLEFGADLSIRNKLGDTPLRRAMLVDYGYGVLRSDFCIVKKLIFAGADVKTRNANGQTVLHLAAWKNDIPFMEYLLSRDLYVHMKDNLNRTPLHCAAQVVALDSVKFLLINGADINALDSTGTTPLLSFLYDCSHMPVARKSDVMPFFMKYAIVDVINVHGYHVFNRRGIENPKTVWGITVEHLAKLRALDIRFNQTILEGINYRYIEYFNKCLAELSLAKNTKLPNSWLSYFHLLVANKTKLKNYAGNEDLVSHFEKKFCTRKFPIYGKSMQKNVSKGVERRRLYYESTKILYDKLPIFNPDHLIIRDTLDCLSTKDLKKFLD